MGLLKNKRQRKSSEIPTTATSDIAFLLLIFFIVMPMKVDEIGIFMALPGKKAQTQTVRIRQRNVLTIKIHGNNSVTVDGSTIVLPSLRSMIEQRLVENPETVVIVETHPDADYGMMVACLDEVKLSDARKVSLKTTGM